MGWIVELWVGEGFETSVLLGKLFIIALLAIAPAAIGGVMMIGLDKLKVLVKFNAVATAVNLALSIYLVQTIGVQGVVIGTVAGSFIILVTYVPAIAKGLGTGLGTLIKASMMSVPAAGLFLAHPRICGDCGGSGRIRSSRLFTRASQGGQGGSCEGPRQGRVVGKLL
jgi:O-antigen/teichoic acid export membrane protein